MRKNKITVQERVWLDRAKELAQKHRRIESELIDLLIKIEKSGCYKKLGCSSLFAFTVNVLELSESVGYCFITVARKASAIEELHEAISGLKLSVSKASRIVAHLNPENARELVDFAMVNSARKIDREIQRRNPCKKKSKFSKNIKTLLDHARDILSSKLGRNVTAEEANEFVLLEFIERHCPVQKAERANARKGRKAKAEQSSQADTRSEGHTSKTSASAAQTPAAPSSNIATRESAIARVSTLNGPTLVDPELPREIAPRRVPLKADETHAVILKTRGQCVFVDASGKRCLNERWLETHHIQAVKDGGTNDGHNLTTLCSSHHAMVHQMSFDFDWAKGVVQDRRVGYVA